MALGTFGGEEPYLKRRSGFTGGASDEAGGGGDVTGTAGSTMDAAEQARSLQAPTPEGQPAIPAQLNLLTGGYGVNLVKNGSFESWPNGASTSAGQWDQGGASETYARNSTNVGDRLYSQNMTNNASSVGSLTQTPIPTIGSVENNRYRGLDMTLSAQVRTSTADRVFIRIDDGVSTYDSRFHTGSGTFETLMVTTPLDAAATRCRVELRISTGSAILATFDSVILVEGKGAVAYSPHYSDFTLTIDNFQNETTDTPDVFGYRAECGQRTTSASAGVSVTFDDQFTTLYSIVCQVTNNQQYFIATDSPGVDGFDLHTYDSTGTRQGVLCYWVAIGATQ